MVTRNPQSTAHIAGHPLHPMLVPFPVAFLVATLVCDLIFWRTGNTAWSTASLYLLGAALVFVALAGVAGLTDFFEAGDAAVLPTGLLISLVVVLILLYTGWRGWEMVYKHRVAVADQEA